MVPKLLQGSAIIRTGITICATLNTGIVHSYINTVKTLAAVTLVSVFLCGDTTVNHLFDQRLVYTGGMAYLTGSQICFFRTAK